MKEQTDTSGKIKKAKRTYAALATIIFVALAVIIFQVTLSNHGSQNSKAPAVATVKITKFGFEPATLAVKQGTKIIWTNTDSSLHQVASNPYPKDNDLPSLKSIILNNDQNYTYTATTAGTFGYHDQMKPTLNGTLVVQKK